MHGKREVSIVVKQHLCPARVHRLHVLSIYLPQVKTDDHLWVLIIVSCRDCNLVRSLIPMLSAAVVSYLTAQFSVFTAGRNREDWA